MDTPNQATKKLKIIGNLIKLEAYTLMLNPQKDSGATNPLSWNGTFTTDGSKEF
jgi:hypothetical protein